MAIQDPDGLADSLYSTGIMNRAVRDQVHLCTSTKEKNRNLMRAVESYVGSDLAKLNVFIDVISQDQTLSSVVRKMTGSSK